MFDIGATELLLVAIVALLVIGPKDLPLAMRTAGRWIGQLRRMTGHFRVGIDAMIREAEIEEQEKAWAEKNAEIMREHPPESDEEAVIRAKEEAAAQKESAPEETGAADEQAATEVPEPSPEDDERPDNPS